MTRDTGEPTQKDRLKRLRQEAHDLQNRVQGDEHDVSFALLPSREMEKVRRRRLGLKRAIMKIEKTSWKYLAIKIEGAAMKGDLKTTYKALNEAMERKQHVGGATDLALREAAKEVIKSLTSEPPTDIPLNTSNLPKAGAAPPLVATSVTVAFTDGSKYRRSGRNRAGAGVFVPALDIRKSCYVPYSMRQTSAAGEVCAVLVLLRSVRHLSPSTLLHIVSDNAYVVFVLNNRLEEFQQQDFSDISHPDLWREIVRELVEYPRLFKADWVHSHTTESNSWHVGNNEADRLAKLASAGHPLDAEPTINLEPVGTMVRNAPPDRLETAKAIGDLNPKSVAGEDRVATKVIQTPENLDLVQAIMEQVWERGEVPEELMGRLTMTFIPKAASGKVRGLTMMNTIVKVICNIIRTRLKVLPMLYCQYGFQRARDVNQAIRMVRHAIRGAQKRDCALFAVMGDFSDAYNHVIRDVLWEVLTERGVPTLLINIIRSTYNASIEVVGVPDATFHPTSGTRQGCPLSPDLFALCLDAAVRGSTLANPLNSVRCVLYADDVILFGEDFDMVQSSLHSFEEQALRMGLTMNTAAGKTEAMYFMPPSHKRRLTAHSSKKHTRTCKGFFSGDPWSNTADTRNGIDFKVETYATHLWCPMCEYIQKEHTSQGQALERLRTHFNVAHRGCSVSLSPAQCNQPIMMPHTLPLRPRQPIAPIPDRQFHINFPVATPVRWVSQYKYLGQVFDGTAASEIAVDARIKCADRSLHSLDRLWALPRLDDRVKLWIMESIVVSALTSSLATLCLTPADIRKLKDFHYRALMCVHRDVVMTDPWGRRTQITYEELVMWTMAQDIDSQMRALRVNLAGRIARASAQHPLRLLPTDEWDELVKKDLAMLNAPVDVLTDRYKCSKLLKRHNPYANKQLIF